MDELPSKLVNILEKTGYQISESSETFEWMLSIQDLNPFFDWIINSITEENFITNDELLCYNHLIKSDQLLSEDELDLKLKNYFSCDSIGYLEESSIPGLEEIIESKKEILNNLSLLKSKLSDELKKKRKHSSIADKLLEDEVNKAHEVHKEYMSQYHILVGKFEILCENISSLEFNVHKKPVYFSQNNLKQFALANTNLELYINMIKKRISQDQCSSKFVEQNYSEHTFSDDEYINKIFGWICQEEFSRVLFTAKGLAAKEALKYLLGFEKNMENTEFLPSLKKTSFTPNLEPRNELIASCESYTKDIIRGIQLNICEERLVKRKNRLEILENLETIVKTRKLCNETLHFMLMNEWKLIRASVSLLQDVYSFWKFSIREFKKRMNWMNRLIIDCQHNFLMSDSYCKEIKQLASIPFPLNSDTTVHEVNQTCLTKLYTSLNYYKKYLDVDFGNYLASIRNVFSEIKSVDHFVFDKPTRVVNFNEEIINLLIKIIKLSKSVSISKEIEEYESLEESTDLLHMMWYEWNKNPFDVIQKILKMEEIAKIKRERHDMMVNQELASMEFKEYSRF